MYLILFVFLFANVLLKLLSMLVTHLFFREFYFEFRKYRQGNGRGHTYIHFLFLCFSVLEQGFYWKMLADKKFRRKRNALIFSSALSVLLILIVGIFVFSR